MRFKTRLTHVGHGEATAPPADLFVAGGYGRSRAAEWVLGGVTRSLLNQPKQFLLLSH